MNNDKIKINNLSKVYYQHTSTLGKILEHLNLPFNSDKVKELCVLRNLNLTIANGERVGLIGRNGAGKSTLLRIVSGMLKPTSGNVNINGKLTALFDTSTGFHPDFTGRQNALANLGYRGITGSQAEKMVEEIIEFSELYDFIDQPFKTYSAGMQSRLTFSVATTIKPDILIVDEILGAGDAYFAAKCLERMKEITQNGATVILVSHSMSAILQFCDRAIWIDRGNILADGRPFDVVEQYQKSVDTYERLRMTAKNAKLQIKLSPSILSGTLGRYLLFRISQKGFKNQTIHIHDISLLRNKEEEHRLIVGGPQDYDAGYGLFIAYNSKESGWGEPENISGKLCRKVLNSSNGDACFFSLFPLETRANDNYSLQLTACSSEPVEGILEIMDRDGVFHIIDTIKLSNDGWSSTECEIPDDFYRIGLESEDRGDNVDNSECLLNIEDKKDEKVLERIDQTTDYDNENIRQRFPDDEGPVFFTAFHMYCNGVKDTCFNPGDSFMGEIEYIALEEVKEPIFVVNITRIDGVRMRQSLATEDGLPIKKLEKGKGRIKFEMNPLMFGPGEYMVSIGVFKDVDLTNSMTMSKPMSLRSNAYEFKILRPKKVLVDMGCVQCSVRWEKTE